MIDRKLTAQDKLAIALAYNAKKHEAPEVVAKGTGLVADKILELANNFDIAIHQDHDLANLLSHVDIGDEIPVEAFIAVAEILSYLYNTNKLIEGERG